MLRIVKCYSSELTGRPSTPPISKYQFAFVNKMANVHSTDTQSKDF